MPIILNQLFCFIIVCAYCFCCRSFFFFSLGSDSFKRSWNVAFRGGIVRIFLFFLASLKCSHINFCQDFFFIVTLNACNSNGAKWTVHQYQHQQNKEKDQWQLPKWDSSDFEFIYIKYWTDWLTEMCTVRYLWWHYNETECIARWSIRKHVLRGAHWFRMNTNDD